MKTAHKAHDVGRKPSSKVSASDILGKRHRTVLPSYLQEPTGCIACPVNLTQTRIEALRDLATPFNQWTCVKCSDLVTTPRLGIFMGEVGTSELKIVDRVYDDSVRDVFVEPDNNDTED